MFPGLDVTKQMIGFCGEWVGYVSYKHHPWITDLDHSKLATITKVTCQGNEYQPVTRTSYFLEYRLQHPLKTWTANTTEQTGTLFL